MKRFLLSLLLVLTLCVSANATTYWTENFDEFSQNWICNLSDCAAVPGVPPGFYEFHANTAGSYGNANSQITTNAERTQPGVSNKRGYRMYLEADQWPTGENVVSKLLGTSLTKFHLRWYQRDSTKSYENFQKLFRIKQPSGQNLIFEWQVNGGHIQMNCWDIASGSNHFFTGYNFDTEYTVNTWNCYEIAIDYDNKTAQFWVNGVSKGTINATWWDSGWYTNRIEIGGNQYGHPWSSPTEHTIDYDDIVVADSYIGPSGASTYTVGGTVTGYPGGTLVLQNNGGDNKTINANGVYTFATPLTTSSPYDVTVLTHPDGYTCLVSNHSGYIDASNISNIYVTCNPTPTRRLGGRMGGGRIR